MARKLPAHLKLHVDGDTQATRSTPSTKTYDLAQTMRAFADATGWVPRPIGGTPHHPLDTPHDSDAPLPELRKRMLHVSGFNVYRVNRAAW